MFYEEYEANFIYIIKQDIRIYLYMLSIAGQTAGPNFFFWKLKGGRGGL